MAAESAVGCESGEISDSQRQHALADVLLKGLTRPLHEKVVPVEYLYDERGSELYERITELEEYYPFETEVNLLRKYADEIVDSIPSGAVIVELGCGTARKSGLIVNAVMKRDGVCRFAGIDVSRSYLEAARTNLLAFCPGLNADQVEVVEATYLEGIKEVRRRHPDSVLCLLWLGSSVGNLNRSEAVDFFKQLVVCSNPKMQLILCVDYWKDTNTLYNAYKDPKGVTEAFIKNGMKHALSSLGYEMAHEEDAQWGYEVVTNEELRCVEMYVRFPSGLAVRSPQDCGVSVSIEPQERVLMEISRKFTPDDIHFLASSSRMLVQKSWGTSAYGIHAMLTPQEAMRRSWADTDDFFFRRLLCNWHDKPVDCRHPFVFYYGHTIAFTKRHLLFEECSAPMDVMFERGINPLCMNPNICHPHPPVPEEWPSKAVIIDYARTARDLVMQALACGMPKMSRVAMSIEHERMHQETLCYMLAQTRRMKFEYMLAANAAREKLSDGTDANGHGKHFVWIKAAHKSEELRPLTATPLPLTLPMERLSEEEEEGKRVLSKQNGVEPLKNGSLQVASGTSPVYEHVLFNKHLLKPTNGAKEFGGNSITVQRPNVRISAGPVCLGENSLPDRFLWDNECPQMLTGVASPLLVASRPVTIAEFREFILKGRGYQRPELWDHEDYAHFRAKGHNYPATWTAVYPSESAINMELAGQTGNSVDSPAADLGVIDQRLPSNEQARHRNGNEPDDVLHTGTSSGATRDVHECADKKLLAGKHVPQVFGQCLDFFIHDDAGTYHWKDVADRPVYVSLSEAMAFCAWAGCRIMTEAEYARVIAESNTADTSEMNAVKELEEGGWEWTRTVFSPFPGFVPTEGYREYSTDFFDGHHFVLKGSAPCTHSSMRRRSFRNFYQRQYPYVFAKFRLCSDCP